MVSNRSHLHMKGIKSSNKSHKTIMEHLSKQESKPVKKKARKKKVENVEENEE